MKTMLTATFGLGLITFLISLPLVLLAFVFTLYWAFVVGTLIGATGLFCMALAVFIKLAALLFRL